jgi:hypothetical protein
MVSASPKVSRLSLSGHPQEAVAVGSLGAVIQAIMSARKN